MNWYVVIGLCADLIGVLLLGADVVRIQRTMRRQAQQRLDQLTTLMDGNTELSSKVSEAASKHAWRNFDYDEGRMVPSFEGVAVESAQEMVDATANAVEAMHGYVDQMAQMTAERFQEDQTTAQSSLKVSYAGLVLIVVGFGLQILGTICPQFDVTKLI